jgi:hypothetical protein
MSDNDFKDGVIRLLKSIDKSLTDICNNTNTSGNINTADNLLESIGETLDKILSKLGN